jgi:drug/metabolite transporter (DMT)-like permease
LNDSSSTKALAEPHTLRVTVWPDASLFGVALIWGINIPMMKIGLDQLDIFVFNAVRLAISSLVLAIFAMRERSRGVLPKRGITGWQVVIYAVMVSAVYQLLFLLGIARTTSGNTALIIATVPMWTALLARIAIGEKLRQLAWCGLLTALVGTIIVALQKGDVTTGRAHLVGNLMILAAALLWACGTVYSRPLLQRISPMQLSAAASVIALPVHLLFAVGRYESSLPVLQSTNLWLIILYAGVLSSGLALPMWNYGVRHAGAAQAAVVQNLIPLIAIMAAWVSRGEPATSAQLVGGALILGGLAMMRWARSST